MEGMRREGSRHNPLMVRLVEMLVRTRMVKSPMNPVDEEIGEQDEDWELCNVPPPSGSLFSRVVDLAVATNLQPERRSRKNRHSG